MGINRFFDKTITQKRKASSTGDTVEIWENISTTLKCCIYPINPGDSIAFQSTYFKLNITHSMFCWATESIAIDDQIVEETEYLNIFRRHAPLNIDIGSPAIDRETPSSAFNTKIDKANPANNSGKITSVEIFARTGYDITGVIIAIFTQGAANIFTARDKQVIGTLTGGGKHTFEVNLDVMAGDYIGIYYDGGWLMRGDSGGEGMWYYAGADKTSCVDETFTFWADRTLSIYGEGVVIAKYLVKKINNWGDFHQVYLSEII